jgi:hypothetical protein
MFLGLKGPFAFVEAVWLKPWPDEYHSLTSI